MHPLYDDEALVEAATREHLDAGRSVFQLFMLNEDESLHSLAVLALLDIPPCSHVLSLGSGVAGMEAYWQKARPDLTFTLVNQSPVQNRLGRCQGGYVVADATTYTPHDPVDLTVIAYALGHMDADALLRNALAATRGTVAVLDVFNTSQRFQREMAYCPPSRHFMVSRGFEPVLDLDWVLAPFVQQEAPWIVDDCNPYLFTRKGEAK